MERSCKNAIDRDKTLPLNILNLRCPEKKFFTLDRKRRGNIIYSMGDEL